MISNQFASVNVNTASDNTVIPAPSRDTQRIVVLGYSLFNQVASAQTVQFKSGSTAITAAMALPSAIGGGHVVQSGSNTTGVFYARPGEALNLTLSAGTAVTGLIQYRYAQG